ncbi:MAG: zf-HC2 domain-containing protein [Elusimicrobiales bacterium]|nr:zf-HC2 domain-containing protein [Elusimicrobiales bacterium]
MSCEYGEKLILYFYGEADPGLKAGVEAHLSACASCRQELAALKLAEEGLSSLTAEPRPAVLAAVMAAARAAGARGFSFGWRELALSGALASVLAGVFAVARPAGREMAWHSGLDSKLDSVEYSLYQEQLDLAASAGDWDYRYSELEDEGLKASENV